jgi:hypothetical protein
MGKKEGGQEGREEGTSSRHRERGGRERVVGVGWGEEGARESRRVRWGEEGASSEREWDQNWNEINFWVRTPVQVIDLYCRSLLNVSCR